MKPIDNGSIHTQSFTASEADLASAIGNAGVDVVSSPATIGYLEMACHNLIKPGFEDDEASVGVGFSFKHLAPAFLGEPVEAFAELIKTDGRKFTFRTEARQSGRLIMTGEHERAVINLGRFLKAVR